MSTLDWVVLLFTLISMVAYGLYKSKGQHGSSTYLLADKKMPWYIVLTGIMATQASAITFLSAPGQAYTDGMRFVQYYFGLPLAMIVICITFIPIFRKLNVYTAYEYLENRFDRKTRLLTSLLFLLSRGLSTGISIYAPSIILSSIMGWNIYFTNVIMGGLLIIYTYSGGAKAIAHTQKIQFLIILSSIGLAGYLVVKNLPAGIGMSDALSLAGRSGKLNAITTSFNWHDKYNIWSGIIGGFFLALSYFGTDQSQVGRYISAKDDRESKMGLLLNGLVKIPMQFLILLIGALLFAFYSFHPAPLYFNDGAYNKYKQAETTNATQIETNYNQLHTQYEQQALRLTQAGDKTDPALLQNFRQTQAQLQTLRDSVSKQITQKNYSADTNDTNYIFLYFVKHTLPKGLVGLLFAVIFLASWGSISAALNSLTSSSLMDIQLLGRKDSLSEKEQLYWGRVHTLLWGVFCIGVAMFAAQLGSLIEAVNILGSLFYGTILGIFLVAFYVKRAGGNIVFAAALITELCIIIIYKMNIVSFLWLNVIGALMVVLICAIASATKKRNQTKFSVIVGTLILISSSSMAQEKFPYHYRLKLNPLNSTYSIKKSTRRKYDSSLNSMALITFHTIDDLSCVIKIKGDGIDTGMIPDIYYSASMKMRSSIVHISIEEGWMSPIHIDSLFIKPSTNYTISVHLKGDNGNNIPLLSCKRKLTDNELKRLKDKLSKHKKSRLIKFTHHKKGGRRKLRCTTCILLWEI